VEREKERNREKVKGGKRKEDHLIPSRVVYIVAILSSVSPLPFVVCFARVRLSSIHPNTKNYKRCLPLPSSTQYLLAFLDLVVLSKDSPIGDDN